MTGLTRKVTLLTFFLAFTLISGVALADKTPAKIGIVDVQRALFSIPAGKAAKKKLERATKKKKKALKAKQAKAQRMQAELEKQAALLQEDAKRRKYREWQRLMVEIQEGAVAAERSLKEKEAKLFGPILKKLEATIKSVALKQGYSLVLERAIYAAPSIDLTDAVIASYGK